MASVESKIASAITGVAAAIVFAFVVVPEIKERRAAAAMNKAMTEFQAEMERETARLSRQQEEAMRQAQRARAAHEGRCSCAPARSALADLSSVLSRWMACLRTSRCPATAGRSGAPATSASRMSRDYCFRYSRNTGQSVS